MGEAVSHGAMKLAYAVILMAAGFLLFYNLESHLLWGDEAETAVLAKNILRTGIPTTQDGVNHITLYGNGIDESADHVWTWSPWLDEYLAAGSFLLFGATTWAARFPFALFGLLSVAFIGIAAYRIYRNHWISLSAMALLSCSEVFLLHARQCRYYSVSVLAEIVFLYGIYQVVTRRRWGFLCVSCALTVQFYSNYIIAVANIPVLFFLAWLLFRENRRHVIPVMTSLMILLACAVPWVLYAHPWRQAARVGSEDMLRKWLTYLGEFNSHFVPIVLMAVLGIVLCVNWWRRRNQHTTESAPGGTSGGRSESALSIRTFELVLLMLIPSYIAVIVLAPGTFQRYMIPVLPGAILLTVAWIYRSVTWRSVAAGLVLVLCLTNALTLALPSTSGARHGLRFPMFSFISGITSTYADRLSDVLAYLKQNTETGQTVAVFDPEFPLIFYTRLKIQDVRFRQSWVGEGSLPEWILSESASGVGYQRPYRLPPELMPLYQEIVIPVHNSARMGVVPEPDLYQYRSSAELTPYLMYRLRVGALHQN